jgi:hypothetical protein
MRHRRSRRNRRSRVVAGAALTAGLTTATLTMGATPASAHYAWCEPPWHPAQSYAYIVCVAQAEVHNNVWHLIFP